MISQVTVEKNLVGGTLKKKVILVVIHSNWCTNYIGKISIAALIKNLSRRTSEHNHKHNYLNFSLEIICLQKTGMTGISRSFVENNLYLCKDFTNWLFLGCIFVFNSDATF